MRASAGILGAGAFAGAIAAAGAFAGESTQSANLFEKDVTIHLKLRYLQALPAGYDDPARAGERWPLLLFLHGMGECGDDLERVKRHGPPRLIEDGEDLGCIVVSPQSPRPGWSAFELHALLDDLCGRLRVDESRLYLTGLSMGGYGTWDAAIERPERFAAIVPICGGGHPIGVMRLRNVPVRAYHGRLDPIVPLSESERLVQALKRVGGDASLTIYDDLAHDSWTRAYEDPELWKWLLAQRRETDGR